MPGSLPSLFASFDVETDGNNPMQHSMRSIGIVLFDALHRIVGTFHYNLLPQEHATIDPKCFANFWAIRPRLWDAVQQNAKSPEWVMSQLSRWLFKHSESHRIVWVASPANFDWMFLKCYYEKYGPAKKYDIGFYCHDLTALLRAFTMLTNVKDRDVFVRYLRGGCDITHNSLDDATCQGHMYMNLRALIRRVRNSVPVE